MKTFTGFIVGMIVASGVFFAGFYTSQLSVPAQQQQQQVGANPGPDISSPYYSVNGLVVFKNHVAMTPNASTTCAMRSPTATSTLSLLAFTVASSSSSATIWEFGSATDPFSTTTLIGTKYNLAAGAQGSVMGSTSPSTGSPIYAPNTWINLKVGAPGANYPKGFCDSTFTVL